MFEAGFRRLQQAAEGVPDRVPFTVQMHELAMVWSRTPSRRFYSDPEAFVSGLIATARDFDLDVPSLGYDVYNIEAEALGQKVIFMDRQIPTLDPDSLLLPEGRELRSLGPIRAGQSGRMPFVLEARRLYRRRVGVAPAIQFCAPFTMAVMLRGYEALVQDIYEDPGFARALLRFVTEEIIAPWIDAQKADMPEATRAVGADALCSPPMVSGAMIEEFSIPYILRLRELCDVPITVINWWGESACRRPDELLDLKRRVSLGLIRVQDPDVATIGIAPFKEYAVHHDLTLEVGIGGECIDNGPPEAIERRVVQYIDGAAAGGRLILYLTNINADTPEDHLRAATAAIRRYGVYP